MSKLSNLATWVHRWVHFVKNKNNPSPYFSLVGTFRRDIMMASWLCDFHTFTLTFFTSCSIFTMATLSYHKYLVISKPFDTFGRERNNRMVNMFICATLLASLFFAGMGFFEMFISFSFFDQPFWAQNCWTSRCSRWGTRRGLYAI